MFDTRTLASGKVAVLDSRQVVFIGTVREVDAYLADFEEPYIEDEDGSVAFARYLEDRAANGTWFGR